MYSDQIASGQMFFIQLQWKDAASVKIYNLTRKLVQEKAG
jgi:hypothetical protein